MANRVNLTDSVVTARKYVSIENKAEQITSKLRFLSNKVGTLNNNNQINVINRIFSDNVITPEEKIALRAEMDHIDSAFNSTTASVKSMELENSAEYLSYKQQYETLKSKMEEILSNMDESTTVAEPISRYIEGYSSAADTLNSYMIAFSNKALVSVSDIKLVISIANGSPTPDETVTFTAKIMKKDSKGEFTELTQEQYDTYKIIDYSGDVTYPKLFQWQITGTLDDKGYERKAYGHKTFSIPASDFAQDHVYVEFHADMIIS